MGFILEKIEEAIKELLIGWIESNMTNMFTDVNDKVGTIAAEVGKTPSSWDSSIYQMIRGLSENVIVPIAGIIITFVLCYELISMTTEKAVAYALGTLQERGQLFIEPGTECYEGMIVGERSKAGDMVVNIARTKNLGNQRSSTSDISVQLVPPRTFSLEEALEYIADDELVEITPKNIRLRKRLLNATDRKKAAVRAGQVNK